MICEKFWRNICFLQTSIYIPCFLSRLSLVRKFSLHGVQVFYHTFVALLCVGLLVMQLAMSRCITQLNTSSKQDEMAVQVCGNVIMCFTVAAQFEDSRKELLEMPSVVKDLCRVMSFKVDSVLWCLKFLYIFVGKFVSFMKGDIGFSRDS